MRISTEAIYQDVYRRVHRGGRGSVKPGQADLRPALARRHKARARQGFRKARRVARNESLPSIEARPGIVLERRRIGDWEDDTMVSRQSAARVKSVTERKSGVTFLEKARDGTAALSVDVYFARPYSSFERGSNENANGLARRFFPKKTDWGKVSREELGRAEYLINTRPRKRHGGKTPEEVFFEATGVAIYS